MTTLTIERVTRIRDAWYAECRTCEHVVQPSILWGLSKCMWLHTSGTGHKTFKLFGFKRE